MLIFTLNFMSQQNAQTDLLGQDRLSCMNLSLKSMGVGAGVKSRALAALVENLGSVPSMHIKWLTAACNASSRVSSALFWPLGSCIDALHIHTLRQILIKSTK